jgi:hypothetical protein
MRLRLALGGLAAAFALGSVAPAQAAPQIKCAEGFELLCTVVCLISKPST